MLSIFAIAYMYLPILIFVVGWTKPAVALIIILATGGSMFYCLRHQREKQIRFNKNDVVELFVLFLFFFALCVFCGQGDLFRQDYDWNKHHAVFRDLMNYEYPVVYDNDVLLTYYLGQYLVPSFVGKLCGHSEWILKWMVPVWNSIGMVIAALLLFQCVKANTIKKKCLTVFCMIFFAGAFYLGLFVYRDILGNSIMYESFKWLDVNRVKVHFPSNFDAFYGDFQHVIVPWIGTGLFLNNKKNYSHYMLYLLPMIFYATFGFVYLAMIMIGFALVSLVQEKFDKAVLKQIFGISNWLMLPLAFVFIIYYLGNVLGEKPGTTGFQWNNMFQMPDFYLIFVLAEFGLYYLVLYFTKKKDSLYWITLLQLLIIPFLSMGRYNDLCSRGSIPARFILMAWVIEALIGHEKKPIKKACLTALLLVGTINVTLEMKDIWSDTRTYGFATEMNVHDSFGTLNGFAGSPDVREDEAYNYFTMDYHDSYFYRIGRSAK